MQTSSPQCRHAALLPRLFAVLAAAPIFFAACAHHPAPRTAATIAVAPPTGKAEADRLSLATAFAAAGPGDTIALAAGTYLIGGAGTELPVSDVVLTGAAAGTVLRGMEPTESSRLDANTFFERANGIALTGSRQTVRGITFEHFATALLITGTGGAGPNRGGGHEIHGNHFRNSVTVELHVDADLPVVVRSNRFTNTYHALAVLGRNVHVVDNEIEATAPEGVPFGWPSLAIGFLCLPGVPCQGHLVAGNRIDGHTDGVAVGTSPHDPEAARVTAIAIRDNAIRMRPVRHSKEAGDALAGTPAVGVAIRLLNLQRAVARGRFDFPGRPAGGWPAAFANTAMSGLVVSGNRIDGAVGVAIEVVEADGNTIVDNHIGPVGQLAAADAARLRTHRTFGVGPGAWLLQGADAANGTAVWVSPGSTGNTVR